MIERLSSVRDQVTVPNQEVSVFPEEIWNNFQSLAQVLIQEDLSETRLREALALVARMTRAESASLEACKPLGLPAVILGNATAIAVDDPGFKLSFTIYAEDGNPTQVSVARLGKDFDEFEQTTFKTAAGLIAYTFKTALKVQEERSERLLSESLQRFSEQLTSTLELEEVLTLILDQFQMLIPYDSANVLLLEDGLLQMHANRGYQQLQPVVHSGELPGICFVPERTVGMREVLNSNEAVILPDTTLLSDWLWLPCGAHVRSWMGVPLLVNGQPIGAIQLDKASPNFFTRKHGELAIAMAVPAALAIENARMLAQIREAKEQLRGLSAQIMQAQEQERSKLAVELHDHAGQALLGLRAELQVLKRKIPSDCKAANEQIEILDEIMIELSQDLRRMAFDLHPPLLSELGLMAALEQYLDEFKRRLQIPISLEVHPASGMERLPQSIELVCYRVVQEALTNLARHAQARSVKVSFIVTDDHLNFSIQDDGIGIPRRSTGRYKTKGFGLLGMRERVLSLGGELQIWSQPGCGTRIEVDIPLRK